MTPNVTLRAILLAASLSAAAGFAVARSSNLLEMGRQTVAAADGKPLGVEAMRKAILAGGATHHWQAVGDQPGVLTLEADSGSHQAVVDVAYDDQGYQITYKSSANLNYEHTDTKTSIHPKYNKWVKDLDRSIHAAATSIPLPSN